ncbi:Unknown protein [Striga hermonthica]|uniref:Uncharacterized protein n=1 Tax=Striga hermonthica TaxID=68872 RepID=A0A9N7MBQ2_STRHE|nr:Unknown protein [Striga hermonthica]
MMGTSGFGQSEHGNRLEVKNDDVWNAYVKPFYGDWLEVFGKERATNVGAQGFTGAVIEVLHNNNTELIPDSILVPTTPPEVSNFSFDPLHESAMESSSTHGGESGASAKGKRLWKRKRLLQVEDDIVGMLSSLCENANACLPDIATGVGFQQTAKEQRTTVYVALRLIPHLSTSQKVVVA